MANKPLKTIQFPNLPDTYTVPQVDTTLSVTGGAADAKVTGDTLAEKADKDGVIATAEGLIGGAYTVEKEPYHFRKTAVDLAGRLDETIVGGSLAWNQLINNGNFASETGWTFSGNSTHSASSNKETLSATGATSYLSMSLKTAISLIGGHKYLVLAKCYSSSGKLLFLPTGLTAGGQKALTGITTEQEIGFVHAPAENQSATMAVRVQLTTSGTAEDLTATITNYQLFDLTAMFGSAIADYISTIETATAGAGVAWVKRYINLDTYHEYDAGSIQSVEGLVSHDVVGFNQWDEEWELGGLNINTGAPNTEYDHIRSKNFIPVIPNTSYKFNHMSTNMVVLVYDADKNYTGTYWYRNASQPNNPIPNNGHYIKFYMVGAYGTTYNHDICINISDPSRNGTYEPYEKHSYPLDSSITLRGVPKLVTDHIEFDGDKYYADGSVVRMYGERAYQSGDESLANAITDGTTTVYKLTTPTTESAQPYQSPQLVGSTEEYVTTGVVPVGHESKYYEDVAKKVSGLPKDFSTLIAPVEVTFTATRNYSVGSYLIVKNQLYKVTSAISSGGTITPNSNVTATTIMAEILALA